MASEFASRFEAAALPRVMAQFGEPVTWYANGTGAGVSRTVVIRPRDFGRSEAEDGRLVAQTAQIRGVESELNAGLDDTVTFDGSTWDVIGIGARTEGMVEVLVARRHVDRVGAEGIRRDRS